MQKTNQSTTVKAGYLRRKDAAKYLGISIRGLSELQSRRMVPFSKLGTRTVLFKISDLDSMVLTYRQNAIGGAE